MVALFTRHPLLLQTAFSEVKRQAAEQGELFVGSPGSVGLRRVKGSDFWYRQFYDPSGRKSAEYLGAAGDPEVERSVGELRGRIELARSIASEARALAGRGYVRVDGQAGPIVATFVRHGLFRAGAVLVGSHAYGVLLNELGARAAAFATEDVDLARGARLALHGASPSFEEILEDSAVPLVAVPGFDPRTPPTSYKARGGGRIRVDLLAPARGREVAITAVPELAAHATALPHLAPLLEEPLDAVILTSDAAMPVRVPRPEAFVWHKMQLPAMRTQLDKQRKDATQAAVIFAVLAEDGADALVDTHARLSAAARRRLATGARQVRARLVAGRHDRALAILDELVPPRRA